jgi:hypothetical protein
MPCKKIKKIIQKCVDKNYHAMIDYVQRLGKEVQMNIPKLKGKIKEKDRTYAECAEAIGLSITTFSNKMNGISKFYIDELESLGNYLDMTGTEKSEIFLT